MTEEDQEELEHEKSLPKLTSAALRANLSLREMIQLVKARTPGGLTTQDVIRSAPESAAMRRRRLRTDRRAEREHLEKAEQERVVSSRYQHRRPHDRGLPGSRLSSRLSSHATGTNHGSPESPLYPLHEGVAQSWSVGEGDGRKGRGGDEGSIIELMTVALDQRPSIPCLPEPEGIQCLILAGCLMSDQTPKPGRVQPIPRLRRLKLDSTVLCQQCDQRKMVSGNCDREICIHDIRTGRHVETLAGHKASVQCLQFDDYKIVSGSWDTTCIVWDVVSFTSLKVLHGHSACVSCLQFNNEKLVTGSHDKSLRIWSTLSWECLTVVGTAHRAAVTCLAFNDSVVSSGSIDKTVKLWSLQTGLCLATLDHAATLTALQLSSLLLSSVCSDGGVYLWSLNPSPSSPPSSPLMQWAMEDGVSFTCLAVDGSRLFAAGSDCVIYEWDIATGMCTRTLKGHSKPITNVWVGNHKIVSTSRDQTVCIWYCKKTITKIEEMDDLDFDPTFVDVPIRVITE